jgi:N-acetylated-alpha-linked acidic dipeptidase
MVPAPDPSRTVVTLYDLWRMYEPTVDPPILTATSMGTGSDFGAFIQHAGIPSLDLGFRAADHSFAGVYHSNYDNYNWMKTFGYSFTTNIYLSSH